MKEKLLNIINHYGLENQQRKLQEEVFELQEVITQVRLLSYQNELSERHDEKPAWKIDEYMKFIEEEIADVYVLLNQFFYYYDLDSEKIQKIMELKVNRQINRMKEEEE